MQRGDEGVGLIEIVVAIAFFAILFVPLANLLTRGDSAIAGAQDTRTAGGIADQQLAADQQSTFPGTWNVNTSNSAAWPATPTGYACPTTGATVGQAFICEVVNGTQYNIYTVGGWCVLNPHTVAWGNGTVVNGTGTPPSPVPATYHVVVRVTWNGKTASNTTNSVDDSTEIPSSSGSPAVGTNVQSCPLGLL